MTVIKCKICGGDMSVSADKTFGTCEYCGSTMTLPKIDDEQRADAFNRGNHFRRIGEFDKALSVYERIVEENPNDAEAHWCCALCRFGIEWVEDPITTEYIPTCHRASFDVFTNDVDYLAAVELSDGITQKQYKRDAAKISEVQKGILATSQNEKPFDVFICYKESDEKGNRTVDSTLAQDIYYQLTEQGFRVFFSRITLEDKVGSEYEPYIFAALNSAKVMVAVGTKPEHFNAVWVKNEWSRFLSIVKHDRSKVLLPCYKDMDPYDLPEQLSVLQSYDMSKIGFIQDLIRGITKVVKADAPKPVVKETVVVGNANVASLLKRAFMFLEDGNWREGDEYCEKVLDQDPENARAYLGKLMAELQVYSQDDLGKLETQFTDNRYYDKIIRFADADLRDALQNYSNAIEETQKQKHFESQYQSALSIMSSSENDYGFIEAANIFDEISEYSNSAELAEECRKLAKEANCEAIYKSACKEEAFESTVLPSKISACKEALSQFERIPEYKDSADKISKLKLEIEELERKYATQKKRNKMIAIILSLSAVAVTAILIMLFTVVIPAIKYNTAQKYIENKQYADAFAICEDLGDYKDSKAKLQVSGYGYAQELIANKEYKKAKNILSIVGNYENSAALIDKCLVEGAKQFYENKEYSDAIDWYSRAKSFNKNEEFYLDACYNYGLKLISKKEYSDAITYLQWAGSHKNSAEALKEAKYGYVEEHKNDEDSAAKYTAFEYLKELKAAKYKDSASIYKNLYAWKVTVFAINSDPDDEETDKSSISKYDPVLFHFKLTGGEPSSSITVSISTIMPSGSKSTGKTSWEMSNGDTSWWGWTTGIYENPFFGMGGKITIKFYDPSGNLIGEDSVNITS